MDIFEAARTGDLETVSKLIHEGADVNALDKHGTPAIYYAAWHDKLDVLKLLLDSGADVNKAVDLELGSNSARSDWTALHGAATQYRREAIKLLLDYGSNINATSYSGRTPLFCAMDEMEEAETAELLIRHGADVNLLPTYGTSLLYMARMYQQPALEKLLIEAGALERPKE